MTQIINKELLNHVKCDIFTPDNIVTQMTGYLQNKGSLLDPACGTGNLLKFIKADNYNTIDLYDIKHQYLQLCPIGNNINHYCSDFLLKKTDNLYDNIIMNPPYIRCQNLTDEYKKQLKILYPNIYNGNIDIYYFFIIKCIQLLSNEGVCVMITPNSWLYNKSAHKLRQFMVENHYIREIIDFKSHKVFPSVSTYCCITILDKKPKITFLYNNIMFEYDNVIKHIDNMFETRIITKEQKTIQDLCVVSNGIATLCDKVFIHEHKLYDEPCWKSIYCGNGKYKWIIYPYDNEGQIITDNDMKRLNPQTYEYLTTNRDILNNRDKGKAKYPTFYSYGRTQSIKLPPNKNVIFMSLFTDPDKIDIRVCDISLYKNCICIYNRNLSTDYTNIINCIKSNKELIKDISPKRGGGWINISTTTIKNLIL